MPNMSPPRTRVMSQSLIIVSSNMAWFLVTKTFSSLQRTLGLAAPFLTYGVMSLVGVITVYFLLPASSASHRTRGPSGHRQS